MAAFDTSLIITSRTTVTPDDGRSITLAEGGQIRGRNAYVQTVYKINVVIKGSVAIKQALETFYGTYTDTMNTLTIDDSDYSAMFTSKPAVTEKDGDIRWIEFGLLAYEV